MNIREILVRLVDHQKQATGIVVGLIELGLIERGGRRVISYGHFAKGDPRVVDGDTIFEIGSVSKIFTSLLLADMVHCNEVALDDPAATYLPAHVRMPERSGRSITLRDLSTHRSGLPSMPGNLLAQMAQRKDARPHADYSVDDLYQFLSSYSLPRDPGSEFEYSNLGAGLLGHLLGSRAGTDYESLVRDRITQPLGMRDTGITLSSSMKRRMATGHNAMLVPVAGSDLPAPLAGAGALRSSANDMLTFLEAFLGDKESALTPAMNAMFDTRCRAGQIEMGLGWFIYSPDGREIAVHNGGTGGFRSYAGYDPKTRIGVVALANAFTAIGVDDIAIHLLNPNAPLANPEPPKERAESDIDPTLLTRYIGRYQVTPQLVLEISRDGDRLFAQGFAQLPQNPPGHPTALPKFELFAEGDNRFFARVSDQQITFETGPDGRATGLIVHKAGRDMPGVRLS
jgi:D-alanyl-D-alanine-carboxypeptidase/D-alanyl-D-alanine-endopeptidase